jgi:hypothetical protein
MEFNQSRALAAEIHLVEDGKNRIEPVLQRENSLRCVRCKASWWRAHPRSGRQLCSPCIGYVVDYSTSFTVEMSPENISLRAGSKRLLTVHDVSFESHQRTSQKIVHLPSRAAMSGRIAAVIGNAAAVSSSRALAGLPVLRAVSISRDGTRTAAADSECILATGTTVVRRSAAVAVCAATIPLRKALTDPTIFAAACSIS